MMCVLTGGAASGKSAHAERILCAHAAPHSRLYVATMQPFGPAAQRRIARHQALRAGKGFQSAERYTDLAGFAPDKWYEGVLLECMANLLANELFSPDGAGPGRAAAAILDGVDHLRARCDTLVVVTNEIFSDGQAYPPETEQYIALLGQINRALVRRADAAAESVCGILLPLKGGDWLA